MHISKWSKARLDMLEQEDLQLHLKLAEIGNKILEKYSSVLVSSLLGPLTRELEYYIEDNYIRISEGESNDYEDSLRTVQFPLECLFSDDFMNVYSTALGEEQKQAIENRRIIANKVRIKREQEEFNSYLELKKKYEGLTY